MYFFVRYNREPPYQFFVDKASLKLAPPSEARVPRDYRLSIQTEYSFGKAGTVLIWHQSFLKIIRLMI